MCGPLIAYFCNMQYHSLITCHNVQKHALMFYSECLGFSQATPTPQFKQVSWEFHKTLAGATVASLKDWCVRVYIAVRVCKLKCFSLKQRKQQFSVVEFEFLTSRSGTHLI